MARTKQTTRTAEAKRKGLPSPPSPPRKRLAVDRSDKAKTTHLIEGEIGPTPGAPPPWPISAFKLRFEEYVAKYDRTDSCEIGTDKTKALAIERACESLRCSAVAEFIEAEDDLKSYYRDKVMNTDPEKCPDDSFVFDFTDLNMNFTRIHMCRRGLQEHAC